MWPEAFHATFIHNIQRKGKKGQDGAEAQVPLPLPPQLPTTTTTPKLLQMKRWGEESREKEPQKTQSHSHACSFRYRPVILGGITNRMQGLKFNQSDVYGNLQNTSNYLQYKSYYTRRHELGKYCGPASSTSSSVTGPTHLERGQLIGKIQKERSTMNIVGWHFSQLVWNRPSSSTCGKAPAHLEKSKRED